MTDTVLPKKGFIPFIKKHKVLTGIVVIAVAGLGYYGYSTVNASSGPSRYVVAPAQNGTLILSVSGTGQVSSKSQIDIKPKVSGTFTEVDVKQGDHVTAGQVVAKIDNTTAVDAVNSATVSLDSAKVALAKLLEPPDKLTLVQDQNAYASAQRALQTLTTPPDQYTITQAQNDVQSAQTALQQAETSATQQTTSDSQTLQTTLQNSYDSVATAFIDATNFIKDLQNVATTGTNTDDNIGGYRLILGSDSSIINSFLNDYTTADALYNSNLADYQKVSVSSDQATIINILNETVAMETALYQNLQDARSMYNQMITVGYSGYSVSSVIQTENPVILNDVTTMVKDISSLQTAQTSIANLNQNNPIDVQKGQQTIALDQQALTEKQQYLQQLQAGPTTQQIADAQDQVTAAKAALDKLNQGTDPLDIQSQKLAIQQQQNNLTQAEQNLADYTVTAPFDGVIAVINAVKGDTTASLGSASGSTAVATIITNQLYANISLNEVDAAQVQVGDKATLTFDALPNISITGQVVQLDTLGTVTSGVVSYSAEVSFDTQDTRIKPGMSVSANVITNIDQDVLLVPNAAVKSQGTAHYVQVLNVPASQSAASSTSATSTVITTVAPTPTPVQIGDSNDTSTVITSGLQAGQEVVTQTLTGSAVTTASATTGAASGIRIPGIGGGGGGFGGGAAARGG